jgi:CheY-like chemotaxis protein
MRTADLKGRSILVVEDEPLIALDIAEGLRNAGAVVLSAFNLRDGLQLASHPDLSAAVLDSTALCTRLTERGVPFVLHTCYATCSLPLGAVSVPKPATPADLVSAIAGLFACEEARG